MDARQPFDLASRERTVEVFGQMVHLLDAINEHLLHVVVGEVQLDAAQLARLHHVMQVTRGLRQLLVDERHRQADVAAPSARIKEA
jgi:hypothetical protein